MTEDSSLCTHCRLRRTSESRESRTFVGDPAGSYDRILDFSTAATGSTFFAPTRGFLESLGD